MTAKVQKSAVSVALALAFAASSAVATPTYVFNSTANSDVPSLTGFSTTGAMMDGMTVRVEFGTGGFESRTWADTGAFSGGASGTGWSLTQSGDTFVGIDASVQGRWEFNIASNVTLQIRRLTLTGNTGFTVFDVDTYDTCDYVGTIEGNCTGGSARGSRLRFADSALAATVTYSDAVGIAGSSPLGDLFHDWRSTSASTAFGRRSHSTRIPTTIPGSMMFLSRVRSRSRDWRCWLLARCAVGAHADTSNFYLSRKGGA